MQKVNLQLLLFENEKENSGQIFMSITLHHIYTIHTLICLL